MHCKSLIFILLACGLGIAYSETMSSRLYRLAYYNSPSKVRAIENLDDMTSSEPMDDEDEIEENAYSQLSARQQSASTGRLFFKRLFGQQQQQPIIPIIVTGASNQGVTSTGTIPVASGTITTTPIARRGYGVEDNDDGIQANGEAYDEEKPQLSQASLAKPGGAQEYVVTHPEIQGTANEGSNSAKSPPNINLRRPGKPGKVVKVRVPPAYTKYFKNGQKVILRVPTNNRRHRNNNNSNRRRKVWN